MDGAYTIAGTLAGRRHQRSTPVRCRTSGFTRMRSRASPACGPDLRLQRIGRIPVRSGCAGDATKSWRRWSTPEGLTTCHASSSVKGLSPRCGSASCFRLETGVLWAPLHEPGKPRAVDMDTHPRECGCAARPNGGSRKWKDDHGEHGHAARIVTPLKSRTAEGRLRRSTAR